jgi:peptide deformylase
MPVRPVVRLGHPALRAPARPASLDRLADPEIQQLIDDLVDTMRALSGVGLSAPQLGVGLRIFVYEKPRAVRDREPGPVVIVNPTIVPLAGEPICDWEGCLSIPGFFGWVPRHPAVHVRGTGRGGEALDYVTQGPEARVVQHELDHLQGVVFLDRVADLKTLRFEIESSH